MARVKEIAQECAKSSGDVWVCESVAQALILRGYTSLVIADSGNNSVKTTRMSR